MNDKQRLQWLRKNANFSCQNMHCAAEISYPADMLKMYKLEPICKECFDYLPLLEETRTAEMHWHDLPDFDPFQGLE